MEEEIWKDIEGFEGLYQVSSEGRVRSLDREVRHSSGGVRIAKGKVLKPVMTLKGYMQVHLSKEGKTRLLYVHRLIWIEFNGEIPEGMQVNHLNEVKTDNRLENLNLMTCKENVNFGTHNQRVAKANTNNPLRSKPVVAFDGDGNVVFEFPSVMEAMRNGFHQGHLSACCRGEQRTHKGYQWKYKENA